MDALEMQKYNLKENNMLHTNIATKGILFLLTSTN